MPTKPLYLLAFWWTSGVFAVGQEAPIPKVADTKISVESGFFDEAFSVSITTATDDATIYYTTDGRVPSKGSIFSGPIGEVYAGPIMIEGTTVLRTAAYLSGSEPTNVDTRSYLFLDQVIRQPKAIEGWPRPNLSVGQGTERHDYEMDRRIVGEDPEAMKASLLGLPTLSLVVDPAEMWNADGDGGFYRNDNEAAVSVELMDPSGIQDVERARGAVQGHSHDRLKRSLRLKFKAEFGDTKWETRLLQDGPWHGETAPTEFDRLILRAGNNRSWARSWNPDRTAYTMDEWYRSTQIAMTGYGARGNFVHLYINGLYWGLYNATERPDRWFTSEHFGGDVESWFAISHGGDQGGEKARWTALLGTIAREDLTNPDAYTALTEHLDVAGLIDYLLLSWYINLTDWPQNNWWAGIQNEPPGIARFFAWDGEWSFGLGQSPGRAWVHPDFRSNVNSGNAPCALLWHAARKHEDFMMLVADRAYKHLLAPGGALTDAIAKERWQLLNTFVREGILAESARWGDALSPNQPRTLEKDWQGEVDRINALLEGNGRLLIEEMINERYYPTVDPPVFDLESGRVPPGSALSLENPNASSEIYFTTDGSDPRASAGAVGESALSYSQPILLDKSAAINARVLKSSIFGGSTWSALGSATYITALPALRISEIMYHPVDPNETEFASGHTNDDDFEYLELVNTGSAPIGLQGVNLSGGVRFEFSAGVRLGPDESAVVVRDLEAFRVRHGETPRVLGTYRGALSNGGEALILKGSLGEVILSFHYDDAWEALSDGRGHSLQISNLEGNVTEWNTQGAWQASAEIGGSPSVSGSSSQLSLSIISANAQEITFEVSTTMPELPHVLEKSSDLDLWDTLTVFDAHNARLDVARSESAQYYRIRVGP